MTAPAPATVLAGLGAHLPDAVVTNDDLSATVDTSDEWIRTRTGIAQRRWAAPGETSLHLAVEAGREALKATADGVTDVDAVIVATMTPDRQCPATAPDVAASLGLGQVAAFDVGAICSGFLYAAATAQGLIAAGTARRVLVIGSETMSHVLHPEDRNTLVIFGDGAGAAVLRAGDPDEPGALGPFDLGADGGASDLIRIDGSGGRRPPGAEGPERDRYLVMEGREVYRRAVPGMVASAQAAVARRGWTVPDLDAVIGHQANVRILDAVVDRLGVPRERSYVNLDRVGNTSAASVPIAMADAAGDGFVRPGDKVLLTAFGAGLTWGSTTLTWPDLGRT